MKRVRPIAGLSCLGLIVLCTATAVLLPRDRSALAGAKSVDVGRLHGRFQTTYFWVSPRQALIISSGDGHDYYGFRAATLDTATGAASMAAALEATLNRYQGGPPDRWRLSPDRTRLLWEGYVKPVRDRAGKLVEPGYSQARLTCRLDGSDLSSYYVPMVGCYPVLWMPDSRQWLDMRGVEQVVTYGVGDPKPSVHHHPSWVGMCEPLGVLPSGKVFGVMLSRGLGDWFGVGKPLGPALGRELTVQFAPDPKKSPASFNSVPMRPDVIGVETAALSPDGKRIAWVVMADSFPRILRPLRRFLHSRYRPVARLRVSDLDGRNSRDLGRLDLKPADLTRLDWTPDGRNVSFLYRNRIWVVPTN